MEQLLSATGSALHQAQLQISLADLAERIDGQPTEQASYLVAMGKSDGLELLGESQKAVELVDLYP